MTKERRQGESRAEKGYESEEERWEEGKVGEGTIVRGERESRGRQKNTREGRKDRTQENKKSRRWRTGEEEKGEKRKETRMRGRREGGNKEK